MKSVNSLLISTDSRYNNSIDVDGKELIVNTEVTERDYHFVNRIATVVGTPIMDWGVDLRIGDFVVVHHNVFRRWYDIRGNERNSGSYIDEDLYAVSRDQVYAYNDGSGWKPTPGYCFVSPIADKNNTWDTSNEISLCGEMVVGPDELLGLTVGFTPNSEYEFNIDGDKFYRVYLNQITWTSKKNAKELLNQPKLHLSN